MKDLSPCSTGMCLNRALEVDCAIECYPNCGNSNFRRPINWSCCEIQSSEDKGYIAVSTGVYKMHSFIFEYLGVIVDAKEKTDSWYLIGIIIIFILHLPLIQIFKCLY